MADDAPPAAAAPPSDDAAAGALSVDTSGNQEMAASPESMAANGHNKHDEAQHEDAGDELPTVDELLQTVAHLQGVVRDIGTDDDTALFDEDESPFTIYRSPNRVQRYYIDPRANLKHHQSSPDLSHIATNLPHGIYNPMKRGTSVVSAISPQKNVNDRYASGLITPPPKRRENPSCAFGRQSSVPRPTTRVAALTRENIQLLPTPQDFARRRNTPGSISGHSQVSRTSARTDGGAVFSRLYQSDYHKNRDEKLRAIRDRQEHLNLSFVPRTNSLHHRTSVSSKDGSVGSSSISSAKTDVVNVSSRLYDPEYVRKRNARLNRLKEEREMRNCTFAPAINTTSSTTPGGNAVPNRRSSSIHLNLK